MDKCGEKTADGSPCRRLCKIGTACFQHSFNKNLATKGELVLESTGLLPELWWLIAKSLNIFDIKNLYLSCSTFWKIFVIDEWFEKNSRYLLLADTNLNIITNSVKDETSEKHKIFNGSRKVNDILYYTPYQNEKRSTPILTVVNSYKAAKSLFIIPKPSYEVIFQVERNMVEVAIYGVAVVIVAKNFVNEIRKAYNNGKSFLTIELMALKEGYIINYIKKFIESTLSNEIPDFQIAIVNENGITELKSTWEILL